MITEMSKDNLILDCVEYGRVVYHYRGRGSKMYIAKTNSSSKGLYFNCLGNNGLRHREYLDSFETFIVG